MRYILSALFAFLMGSMPFSYIVGRVTRHIDIRQFGSKNAGAGNVFHFISVRAGIVALAGDVLKGVFALYLPYIIFHFSPPILTLLGLAAVLGHVYSPFLQFKGGKGAATTVGAFLFILFVAFDIKTSIYLLLVIVVIWIILLLITHSQVISLSVVLPIFSIAVYFASKNYIFFITVLLFAIVEELFGLSSIKREWKSSYDKYLKNLIRRS